MFFLVLRPLSPAPYATLTLPSLSSSRNKDGSWLKGSKLPHGFVDGTHSHIIAKSNQQLNPKRKINCLRRPVWKPLFLTCGFPGLYRLLRAFGQRGVTFFQMGRVFSVLGVES